MPPDLLDKTCTGDLHDLKITFWEFLAEVNRYLPLFLIQREGAKVTEEQKQRLLTSNKEKCDCVRT